jgi:hypothetical protein
MQANEIMQAIGLLPKFILTAENDVDGEAHDIAGAPMNSAEFELIEKLAAKLRRLMDYVDQTIFETEDMMEPVRLSRATRVALMLQMAMARGMTVDVSDKYYLYHQGNLIHEEDHIGGMIETLARGLLDDRGEA